MTILDTVVMVALLNGKLDTVNMINELQEKKHQFAMTIITAYELLKGLILLSDEKKTY